MTELETDPLALAEALIKERRDAVKTLAKLAADKAALNEKIAELDTQESAAYEAALATGWSQSELKQIGFTRRGTARKARKSDSTEPTHPTTAAGELGQDVSV